MKFRTEVTSHVPDPIPQVSLELVSPFGIYDPFPKVTCYRTVQNSEVVRTATCPWFIFWVWSSDHRNKSLFHFWNIFKNSIWTSVAQDIAIFPRCPVYGWFLKEDRTLTLRDHISQNTANIRLIFGHRVNHDFIFVPWNFHILRLRQSRTIATVPKLSSFSI